MSESTWNAPAPGDLELVRRFLNTWKVPDGTRKPIDELSTLLRDPVVWEERFPHAPIGSENDEGLLKRLREDLRGVLDAMEGRAEKINGWLEDYPLIARVVEEEGEYSVCYEPPPEAGFAGRVLAAVAEGVGDGTFSRLKACPDCRWVFYDRSRSKTRVWCGMYAGQGGRACGTIAKVKRYRQKRRAIGSA
jgi:hypothetical protein